MPPCKNDRGRRFIGNEPSPKGFGFCAHAENIGTIQKGQDGMPWIVKKYKVHRWVKVVVKNDKTPKETPKQKVPAKATANKSPKNTSLKKQSAKKALKRTSPKKTSKQKVPAKATANKSPKNMSLKEQSARKALKRTSPKKTPKKVHRDDSMPLTQLSIPVLQATARDLMKGNEKLPRLKKDLISLVVQLQDR